MLLETVDVKRVFRSGESEHYALKGVNLKIHEQGLVVLKGRSGSGKTTLLNILGSLDQPTEGLVNFEGHDIGKLSEAKKVKLRKEKIGFIFQSSALVPLMTLFENVELGLRIAEVPRGEWQERVEKAIDYVGLTKRAKHRPLELSGGEQQRCAIARAFVHHPKLILADEPTAELDTEMGIRVIHLFKKLIKNESMTVVMTTHDPTIMEMADQVYELEDGQIV